MSQQLIRSVEEQYLKQEVPLLLPGDTVRVNVLIKEGGKERVQAFEGLVLRVRGGGLSKTFTVRKVFQGIGVERTFLIHSPRLESIKVLRRGRVRQARLYYIRELSGKSARIREKTTGVCAPGKAGSLLTAKVSKPAKNKKSKKSS